MDILWGFISALLIFTVVVLWGQIRDLKTDMLRMRSEIASTRQAKVKSFVRSTATPGVDARARTTRRDTDDLPRTGRMSQGVHRKKTNAREPDDYRLPDDTGPEATQVR